MWLRLDRPELATQIAETVDDHCELYLDLLQNLAARDWARRIWITSSMGRIALTTAPHWDETTGHGSVAVFFDADGKLVLKVSLPHGAQGEERSCEQGAELHIAETAVRQLLAHSFSPSRTELSTDTDPKNPGIRVGEHVEVITNEYNRTAREGHVAKTVWHHKNGCWFYLIEEKGRLITKRYLLEDFMRKGPPN